VLEPGSAADPERHRRLRQTRLAIKLAEKVLPSFPDGVWFVDLAPISDAERVQLAVASTLGIRNQADRPRIDTLCEYLAKRRTLLCSITANI